MILTDTHIHLYYNEFNEPIESLLKSASDKKIQRFFLPNVDSESIPLMYALHKNYPDNTFMMMGLHPCSVKENWKDELAIVEYELGKHKFYGIGEIGIDLYWDKTFLQEQQQAFAIQIKLALAHNLPFVIHCRDAFDETIAVLREIKKEKNIEKFNGIFHCFSGNIQQAFEVIELGFLLGIGGVVTFKNSGLDKVVEAIDIKHLVLETDAPYLAPVPYRGKVNKPVYLYDVAEKLAFIKKTTVKEIAHITTENSIRLFGK